MASMVNYAPRLHPSERFSRVDWTPRHYTFSMHNYTCLCAPYTGLVQLACGAQFVHGNGRVFGYNSPLSLALRNQDRIVVAPHNALLPLPDMPPDNGAAPMEE